MQYRLDHYTYRDVYEKNWQPEPVAVTGGAPADGMWVGAAADGADRASGADGGTDTAGAARAGGISESGL